MKKAVKNFTEYLNEDRHMDGHHGHSKRGEYEPLGNDEMLGRIWVGDHSIAVPYPEDTEYADEYAGYAEMTEIYDSWLKHIAREHDLDLLVDQESGEVIYRSRGEY